MFRLTVEEQEEFIMEEYSTGWAARAEQVEEGEEGWSRGVQEPEDEIIRSGVSPDNIRKWRVLQSVQDRNETLFYRWSLQTRVQ